MRSSDEKLIRMLICESLVESKSIPEYASEAYSSHLDELIDELKSLKHSLRKGPNRSKNRKESYRIQSAIQALRFLKNSSNRQKEKLLISSEKK